MALELEECAVASLQSTLLLLLIRNWFKRVWIIQEVGSARIASILCGNKSVSSSTFSVMHLLLDLKPAPHAQVQAVLGIMPGPLRKQSWWNTDRTFLTLLGQFNESKATRAHDRIYALLGIASDAPELPIEYGCPFQQVVEQTVALLTLGDTKLGHLLRYRKPMGSITAFNLNRIFQGITDINSFALRVFKLACEDHAEEFLRHLIDSPLMRTVAHKSGYQGSLPFAISLYDDWNTSNQGNPPRMTIFEDAWVEETVPADDSDGGYLPPLQYAPVEEVDTTLADLPDEDTETHATKKLWRLCRTGNENNVYHMLDRGAAINGHQAGRTPLHDAVCFCRPRVVRILVGRGADLAARDELGYTPLHVAELKDAREIVAFLLTHGADELAVDRNGRTPWQLNWSNHKRRKQRTRRDINQQLMMVANVSDRSLLRSLSEERDDKEDHTEDLPEKANSSYTWERPQYLEEPSNKVDGVVGPTAPRVTGQGDRVAVQVFEHDGDLPVRGKGVV